MPAPRQPRPATISTTPLFLFFGLVALLGVILGLIGRVNRKMIDDAEAAEAQQEQQRAEEQEAAVDPFADLPDEVGLGLGARGGRWKTAFPRDPNPTGIEAEPVWQDALNQADAAWALADEARRALEADDASRHDSKARAARIAFEKALEATVSFEAEIIAAHGDRDEKVRKIIRTRAEWAEQAQHFLKAVGY